MSLSEALKFKFSMINSEKWYNDFLLTPFKYKINVEYDEGENNNIYYLAS